MNSSPTQKITKYLPKKRKPENNNNIIKYCILPTRVNNCKTDCRLSVFCDSRVTLGKNNPFNARDIVQTKPSMVIPNEKIAISVLLA